jgi:hypothetical protein
MFGTALPTHPWSFYICADGSSDWKIQPVYNNPTNIRRTAGAIFESLNISNIAAPQGR